MKDKKNVYLALAAIVTGILFLTGCRSGSAPDPAKTAAPSDMDGDSEGRGMTEAAADIGTDAAILWEEGQGKEEEKTEVKESESEEENEPVYVPQLPDTGRQLEDFVPEGWELLDSVELDFNEDGRPDHVGVLEVVRTDEEGHRNDQGYPYPRILFAVSSDGTDGYRLDFHDINLIRTGWEGGIYGDPYLPLTGEGTSFTTHAFGGSAWKWSEDNTYTYRKGTWRLTLSEHTYGYGEYTSSYHKNDWESRVGIRKERSDEFMDMFLGDEEYDAVYEVTLDEPITLEQAGKRWWLAPDRVTDWKVEAITFAEDVELAEDMVRLPEEAHLNYCDEDCVLYGFNAGSDIEKGFCYLAMYRWQDKVLSVLAKEESKIDDSKFYNGKIYYSVEIVEKVAYKAVKDGKEQITEEEDTVGIRLNRMEPDGTGKETVFEYRCQEAGEEILENRIPYLWLSYEISGGEIIAKVYIGGHSLIYRMKTDGSQLKRIGQIPKE